jgi:hypothetical protein
MLRNLATWITLWATPLMALAQDADAEPAQPAPVDPIQEFLRQYMTWDAFKVGWLLATFVVTYGIATFVYLAYLKKRRADPSAKLGCFWGAVTFLAVHVIVFGILLTLGLPNWLGWAVALVLLFVIILIMVSRRRR